MKTNLLLFGTVALSIFFTACSNNAEEAQATGGESEVRELVAQQPEEEPMEEAKEVQIIHLNQIPGEFTNGDITLEAGTYSFDVTNTGIDHEVGLVLAPKKEDITPEDHLQGAYVSETVKEGDTQACKGEVTLEKGEYVYFCPLNPTPQYTITVE